MTTAYPVHRPRRLRQSAAVRRLVAETRLHPAELVLPAFVREEPPELGFRFGVAAELDPDLREGAARAAELGLITGEPTHRQPSIPLGAGRAVDRAAQREAFDVAHAGHAEHRGERVATRHGRPYSGDGFRSVWMKVRKGIEQGCSFHDIRATGVSHLKGHGVDDRWVMLMTGHQRANENLILNVYDRRLGDVGAHVFPVMDEWGV